MLTECRKKLEIQWFRDRTPNNIYIELLKYLNANAMFDPSGIQPSERGAVAQHDLAVVNLDCCGRLQMGERAGHRLEG